MEKILCCFQFSLTRLYFGGEKSLLKERPLSILLFLPVAKLAHTHKKCWLIFLTWRESLNSFAIVSTCHVSTSFEGRQPRISDTKSSRAKNAAQTWNECAKKKLELPNQHSHLELKFLWPLFKNSTHAKIYDTRQKFKSGILDWPAWLNQDTCICVRHTGWLKQSSQIEDSLSRCRDTWG